MRCLVLAAFFAVTASAFAQTAPSDSPLSALKPVAAVEVGFTPGVPLLTDDSRAKLKPAIAEAKAPSCYWLAEGRSLGEAEALRAAIAEFDIAVETIVIAADPAAASARARAYCTPPVRVTAYFLPGRSDLTDEARGALSLAIAAYWKSSAPLVVRGYAGGREMPDPLKLGLDRAQTARDYLIAAGLPAKNLAIEANTQATGRAALRVEIMASAPR